MNTLGCSNYFCQDALKSVDSFEPFPGQSAINHHKDNHGMNTQEFSNINIDVLISLFQIPYFSCSGGCKTDKEISK